MIQILTYYNPIKTAEGYILSVDKVAIDYKLRGPNEISALGRLINNLEIRYAVKTNQWESLKIGRFRENFTVTFQDRNSYWLGVSLNSVKTEWQRVRLEVNPNKCAQHASFLDVLAFLNGNSRPQFTTIKRFDLAVDVPVERDMAKLVKDGRIYSERRHGQDWTEYLGAKASHIGRVKLYNKQSEAGLNKPLTRLEVTLDPAIPFEKIPWPQAYYVQEKQIGMDELNTTKTERYILSAILAGFGTPKDLCRKTREKMEALIGHYVQYIKISKKDYHLLMSNLRSFLTCPENDLELAHIDYDQPNRYPRWVKEAENSEKVKGGEQRE